MKQFVLKYLIGGYGVFGKVMEDCVSGETHEEVLNQFWKRYDGMLDCVKPTILGLYFRERGDTRPMCQKKGY